MVRFVLQESHIHSHIGDELEKGGTLGKKVNYNVIVVI